MKPFLIYRRFLSALRHLYKGVTQVRSRTLVFLTHRLALPVLKVIRQPEIFPYTKAELLALPEGTLGKDLVGLLEANQLELLTHYAKHDMKHILLGYPTTEEGEVCLQAFMLGNGHISFPVFTTVVFGTFTMPEHWHLFRAAWRRGRQASSLQGWNWPELVHCRTRALQQVIFNESVKN